MKKTLALLIILFSASIIQAQPVEKLFEQMEKLAAKAKGQVFESHSAIYKETVKLGRQEFSQSSVICRKINKHDTKVTTYTSIPWHDIKKVYYLPAEKNDKLIRVNITFNGSLKSKEMYESTVYELTVYVLRKDGSKARDIMDTIVAHFKES